VNGSDVLGRKVEHIEDSLEQIVDCSKSIMTRPIYDAWKVSFITDICIALEFLHRSKVWCFLVSTLSYSLPRGFRLDA
jgi:hypothetical protein